MSDGFMKDWPTPTQADLEAARQLVAEMEQRMDPSSSSSSSSSPAAVDTRTLSEKIAELVAAHHAGQQQADRNVQQERDDLNTAQLEAEAVLQRARADAAQQAFDDAHRLTQESIARSHATTTRTPQGVVQTMGLI